MYCHPLGCLVSVVFGTAVHENLYTVGNVCVQRFVHVQNHRYNSETLQNVCYLYGTTTYGGSDYFCMAFAIVTSVGAELWLGYWLKRKYCQESLVVLLPCDFK